MLKNRLPLDDSLVQVRVPIDDGFKRLVLLEVVLHEVCDFHFQNF